MRMGRTPQNRPVCISQVGLLAPPAPDKAQQILHKVSARSSLSKQPSSPVIPSAFPAVSLTDLTMGSRSPGLQKSPPSTPNVCKIVSQNYDKEPKRPSFYMLSALSRSPAAERAQVRIRHLLPPGGWLLWPQIFCQRRKRTCRDNEGNLREVF